jgi:hypothetical protein
MRKKLLYLVFSSLVAFSSTCAWAGAKNTPVEAFINREKEQTEFVPISGLWSADNSISNSALAQQVSDAQLLQVNFGMLTNMIENPARAISLTIPGTTYTIDLARFDFMASGFQMYTKGNGLELPVAYTPGVYYRGVVNGIPGSVAAFSFYSNQVSGTFAIPGVGNFVLGQHTIGTAEQGHYVLYNDMNLKIQNKNGNCATDNLPQAPSKTAAKNVLNSCRDIELFILADFDMFTNAGNSTQVVGDYLFNVYNMVATLYRNEAIYTSIKAITVNTSFDQYSSMQNWAQSDDYLFEFGDDIQSNLHGADIAMLVSTVPQGLGGIAWLDALCANYSGSGNHGPYSFCNIQGDWNGSTLPKFSWDIEVMTHEMGHNFGSPHTHSCVWNGNNTAIDACVSTTGGCGNPTPKFPTNGGTIMSYCHLAPGVGINFANGFGTQPGDVIRNGLNNAFCATNYLATRPTTSKAKTIIANRECTDENDITYYWNDNNNAREDDDVLALKIRKAGSSIGNLDDGTMSVKSATSLNYSNGSGVNVAMPAGTLLPGGSNVGPNRYWRVTPTTQPTGEVEVIFPLMTQDITDLKGSIPNSASLTATNMMVYAVNNTAIDPNPASGLVNATPADINVYTNSSSASTSNWSIETTGDTIMAHFNVKKLSGGSLLYSYSQDPQSVHNIYEEGTATFFPNPTHTNWNVYVPKSGSNIVLNLYTVDGRSIATQQLNGGVLNEVKANQLPAGLYYYRISSETATFTGTLQKK